MQNMLPLLIVALGIIFLLVLITKFKLNTFISLIITAFAVGLALEVKPTAQARLRAAVDAVYVDVDVNVNVDASTDA